MSSPTTLLDTTSVTHTVRQSIIEASSLKLESDGEMSVSVVSEASIWEDWSGRGSHVDFGANEMVPLNEGRLLGYGLQGGVFEVHCKGIALAWKRRYCRYKIGPAERKEIEILKRLSHVHIIRLVGTYTHLQFLGLLLYPVAVCDMATYFEDVEVFHSQTTLDSVRKNRLAQLGLPSDSGEIFSGRSVSFLFSKIGCIITAIEYLHNQRIRHKDLKPPNILLSSDKMWVSDFGSATDFSMLSVSSTENGERGTPKYFAPEVARFLPSGRAADIFSLGCILLEIVTLNAEGTLNGLRALRTAQDGSFQANLQNIDYWFNFPKSSPGGRRFQHLLLQIKQMLAEDPQLRPTTGKIHELLTVLDQFLASSVSGPLFGNCCSTPFISRQEHIESIRQAEAQHKTEIALLNGKKEKELHSLKEQLEACESSRLALLWQHEEDLTVLKTQNEARVRGLTMEYGVELQRERGRLDDTHSRLQQEINELQHLLRCAEMEKGNLGQMMDHNINDLIGTPEGVNRYRANGITRREGELQKGRAQGKVDDKILESETATAEECGANVPQVLGAQQETKDGRAAKYGPKFKIANGLVPKRPKADESYAERPASEESKPKYQENEVWREVTSPAERAARRAVQRKAMLKQARSSHGSEQKEYRIVSMTLMNSPNDRAIAEHKEPGSELAADTIRADGAVVRPTSSASDRGQVREARGPTEEQMEPNNDNEQVERNKLRKHKSIFDMVRSATPILRKKTPVGPLGMSHFPSPTISKLSNTSKGDTSTEPSRSPH